MWMAKLVIVNTINKILSWIARNKKESSFFFSPHQTVLVSIKFSCLRYFNVHSILMVSSFFVIPLKKLCNNFLIYKHTLCFSFCFSRTKALGLHHTWEYEMLRPSASPWCNITCGKLSKEQTHHQFDDHNL